MIHPFPNEPFVSLSGEYPARLNVSEVAPGEKTRVDSVGCGRGPNKAGRKGGRKRPGLLPSLYRSIDPRCPNLWCKKCGHQVFLVRRRRRQQQQLHCPSRRTARQIWAWLPGLVWAQPSSRRRPRRRSYRRLPRRCVAPSSLPISRLSLRKMIHKL